LWGWNVPEKEQKNMKKIKIALVAALCLSLTAALCGLAACGTGNNANGAVAATVNGTAIMEQDVTDTIEAMRTNSGDYSDPTAWAQALQASGLTPETLRESVIKSKAQNIVITQEATNEGFSPDEDSIEAQITQTRSTVGATDDDATWLKMLQSYGYKDEQAFRDMLTINDLTKQLYDNYTMDDPTDDQLRTYIAANPTAVDGFTVPGYVDTTADTDTTDTTATDTATDDTTATDTTATDDTTAADTTATDDTTATGDTSTSDQSTTPGLTADDIDLTTIPSDVLSQYKDLYKQDSTNKGTAFQAWIQSLVDAADIVINDMPADVPYNVDMSLATSSTDTSSTDTSSTDTSTTTDYSSDDAVSAAVAAGLVITDDVVGTGDTAVSGSVLQVHYTGTLDDGTVFDSNTDTDTPFQFTLGSGQVIRGWDAGLVGMQVGGTRTLTIPASLGYGDTANGSIPANSTLTFTVELVSVTSADQSSTDTSTGQ